ncbi:dynamin family protein [Alkalicoccus chagannorensis]|uniref:dynamin family protein n=1 Tax=Alkalicoccus chagannorensis TaxID=427072 RepID=UPI0003F71471|nr:dynamin family protein [Alkalicoccus chagannorensis]
MFNPMRKSKNANDSIKSLEAFFMDIAEFLEKEEGLKEKGLNIRRVASNVKKPLVVVIIGEFKSGKSSIINTILNEDLLKADVTPKTATVTEVVYGEEMSLVAQMNDGREKTLSIDDLDSWSSEGDTKKTSFRDDTYKLILSYPHPVLKEVTFVDTPGLNAMNERHEKATVSYLKEADMFWWIFNYMSPGRKTEMKFIDKLDKKIKKIAIVNKIDGAEDEEDFQETMKDFYRKNGDGFGKIIAVSAKEALSNSEEVYQRSGWDKLTELIQEEIAQNASQEKMLNAIRKTRRELNNTFDLISKHKTIRVVEEENLRRLNTQLLQAKAGLNYLNQSHKKFEAEAKQNILFCLAEKDYLPLQSLQADQINRQKELLLQSFESLLETSKELNEKNDRLKIKIEEHNSQFDAYGGNALLEDNLKLEERGKQLNIKRAMLRNKIDGINTKLNRLKTEAEEIEIKMKNQLEYLIEGYDMILSNLTIAIKESEENISHLIRDDFPSSFRNRLGNSYKRYFTELRHIIDEEDLTLPWFNNTK